MTTPSVGLQNYVIAQLLAAPDVTAQVGSRIYDGAPASTPAPYITLGDSDYLTDDTDCTRGRTETLVLDVWVEDGGKRWPCRQLCDHVVAALRVSDGASITAGYLHELTAAVRVIRDPDGITSHGIVTITAVMDENAD